MLQNQALISDERLGVNISLPFIVRIMQGPIPTNFKIPYLEIFDGSRDPSDHLERFQTLMLLRQASDGILCRAFPSTLKRVARHWYSSWKPGSIDFFGQLSRSFAYHFISNQRRYRGSDYLVSIKQRGESLRATLVVSTWQLRRCATWTSLCL